MANDIKFAKGVKVSSITTQYGKIYNVGIKVDEFVENDMNQRGYINIQILESKSGKPYAKLDEYKKKEDEEIPF